MPAVAPVYPRIVEVPRHPGSPPSYREVAAVTGLNDAKLATTQNPIRAAVGGFEVGEDGGGIVVELDAHYLGSPGRSNAPPSYEDALRSPAPAETSACLDHVHSLQGEGGAEYDSLGFPIPEKLSPRYEEIRVTFPAARARQLVALEAYRASAPEARAPGGEARRMLAHEGVHFLHRANVWSEALCSGLKEDAAGVSYDEYLERGCDLQNQRFSAERDMIRRDLPHVFPSHPRFVRSAAPSRRASSSGGDGLDSYEHSVTDFAAAAAVAAAGVGGGGGGGGVEGGGGGGGEGGGGGGGGGVDCGVDGMLPLPRTRCGDGHEKKNKQNPGYGRASGNNGSVDREKLEYCLLDALERLLVAIMARSPQGYCPAMCTAAGVLLLEADDEENAFWMLVAFVEDAVPWLFTRSATALNAEATAVDFAVEVEFPALHAKLRAASVRPALLFAGWITRLGVTVLPGEGVLRLWDAIILEGADVLSQAVLAFLRLHGDALAAIHTGGGDGGGDGGAGGGAALLDAVDECAAGQFMMDEVVAAAVESARVAREDHAWLRLRCAARAAVATRAADLGSLRELLRAFRGRAAAEAAAEADAAATAAAAEAAAVTREEFDAMVAAAYPPESELGTAAAAAAVTGAYEEAQTRLRLTRRRSSSSSGSSGRVPAQSSEAEDGEAIDGRSLDVCLGVSYEGFVQACRAHPTVGAQLRLIELEGATVELRMRRLLHGQDQTRCGGGGGGGRGGGRGGESAPSPSSLAAAVRASHTAMGIGITVASAVAVAAPRESPSSSALTSSSSSSFSAPPQQSHPLPQSSPPRRQRIATKSSAAAAAAANAAALESAMLFGCGGERWLESVRLSARGSLVLSAVVSSVYAASPPSSSSSVEDEEENYFSQVFEVSVVRTRDVVPSMGSLFTWPPCVPHTQYNLLVQRPGAAPYVLVKRYNDFRTLHARAERDGVCLSLGPSLELPNTGSFAAFSSDPRVVALRSVGLQRYLDLLACGGCQSAAAHLRLFLALDGAPRQTGCSRPGAEAGGGGARGVRVHYGQTVRAGGGGGGGRKKKVRGGCGGCGLTSAAGLDCADFIPSFF